MSSAVASLPDDIDALRALCAWQAEDLARQSGQLQARDNLIGKLREQLAALKRARFGKSSEKIERSIAQLELGWKRWRRQKRKRLPCSHPRAPNRKPSRCANRCLIICRVRKSSTIWVRTPAPAAVGGTF